MLNKTEGQHFRSHQIVFYTLFFDGGDPYLDMNMARFKHIFQLYDEPEDINITATKKTRKNNKKAKSKTYRSLGQPGPDPDPVNPDDEEDDPDTLIEIVQWSVDNYYKLSEDFNETMLDRYTPINITDPKCFMVDGYIPVNQTLCPVRMDVQFLDGDGYKEYNSTLYLTYGEYWIFNNDTLTELKTFIQSVTSFTLTYNVKVDYPDT